MPDTAPAAVAAPAAPVVPVVAAAPAVPVAAAVATPEPAAAAPAAAAVVPPVVAAPAGESLLDKGVAPAAAVVPPVVTLEDAQKIVEAARLAAQPNSGAAWNLNDTTPGVGEKPSWFKNDKYVSVAKQAEAYTELEKRFGSFAGAPKDDKGNIVYKPTLPEGVTIDSKHPLMVAFDKAAGEMQMSQVGYDRVLGMLAQYEATQAPNLNVAKAALGANADARISAVASWAKNNLDDNGFQLMRAVTSGKEMAPAFALLEQMIAKTGTVRMPKPGDDVASPTAGGKEAIVEMQGKKNDKGQRLYDVDPAYRKTVEAAWTTHFTANPVVRDRQGNARG
jgi:hypothetical protein